MTFRFPKSIVMLSVALLAMSACSNDDIIEQVTDTPSSDLITYSVNVPAATRAATVYNSTTLPSDFYVWASYNDGTSTTLQTFFNCDKVTKESGSTTYQGKGSQYWPASGKINFFAIGGITPASANWAWDTNFTAPTYTYENTATADLLYAVKKDQERPSSNIATTYVPLNFRHALSQIAFTAQVTNPALYVEITSVTVNNTYKKGTFTFPSATTTAQITGDNKTLSNTGSWTFTNGDSNSNLGNFSVNFGESSTSPAKIPCYSSGTTSKGAVACSDVLLIMPSNYTAWNPNATDTTKDKTGNAYFTIKCTIYNSLDGISANVKLWEGDIYVPATFNWSMGYRYTYNFIFGTGSGGYDENGNPALYPIQYTWTCDDWIESTASTINMETSSSN